MKKFDTLVYIGRFQPFHKGHQQVIEQALKLAETVLVCVGSADAARSPKNPWTAPQRRRMILNCFNPSNSEDTKIPKAFPRVLVFPIDDKPTDEQWKRQVFKIASQYGHRTGIIGHSKDESSYYLRIFPTWEYIEVPNYKGINATDIRQHLLLNDLQKVVDLVPESTYTYLTERVNEHLEEGLTVSSWAR